MPRALRRARVSAALAAVVVLGLSPFALAQSAIEITASALNVRSGPSTGYGAFGTARRGDVYASVQRSGSWHRIWFGSGLGWVHGDYVRASGASLRSVSASGLNVRTGPGTQYGVIGVTPRGSVRAVLETRGSWARVSFAGRVGWCHASYLGSVGGSPASSSGGGSSVAGGGSSGGSSSAGSLPRSSRGFLGLPASGAGFYTYSAANRRYGRDYFIYGVLRIGEDWARTGRPRMGIGDVSLTNGGPMSGHASHQKGVDIDVRPVQVRNEGPVTIYQTAYSRSGTQALIDLYYRYTPVTMIFFNDSAVRGVRYWQNHHGHFHVRVQER